jgi:hypothetical protein
MRAVGQNRTVKRKLGGKRNYGYLEKLKEIMVRLLECTLLYDGNTELLVELREHFKGDRNSTERI